MIERDSTGAPVAFYPSLQRCNWQAERDLDGWRCVTHDRFRLGATLDLKLPCWRGESKADRDAERSALEHDLYERAMRGE